MFELIASILICIGTFFILVGSIGLVRMPDLYTRIHTMTKSVTLGLVSLILAAGLALWSWDMAVKVSLAVVFHFLTNPAGAHMITRAAYHHLHVPFWKNTITDEWMS